MARYSDQEKSDALAALDANGGNVSRTARMLGIPRVTLLQWRDGAGVSEDVSHLRHQKKEALAERLEAIAHEILDASPEKLAKASLKDSFFAFGIAVDKMQVLRGDPNAITESRQGEVTPDERVKRIAGLLERIDAGREGAEAEPGHAGTVGETGAVAPVRAVH